MDPIATDRSASESPRSASSGGYTPCASDRRSSSASSSSCSSSRNRVGAALGVLTHEVLRELELDAEGDEPLLGSVVQVALDPAAFPLGARRDARAGPVQLADRHLRLSGETLVVEDDGGHRRSGLDQLRPPLQAFVVDDRGDHGAVVAHVCDPAPGARRPAATTGCARESNQPSSSSPAGNTISMLGSLKASANARCSVAGSGRSRRHAARLCSVRSAYSRHWSSPRKNANATAGTARARSQAATSSSQAVGST